MRKGAISAMLFSAVLAAAAVPVTRGLAQSPFGDPDATPAPFNPQMSALMNMLIQPRHTKLWYAGKAENWALAGYLLGELKQGFMVISRAVPRWKGLPVPDLADAAVTQPLTILDFAIKAGEPREFAQAYDKLTTACNNCHSTMERAFIVIKTPDAASFPDQDFSPKR